MRSSCLQTWEHSVLRAGQWSTQAGPCLTARASWQERRGLVQQPCISALFRLSIMRHESLRALC